MTKIWQAELDGEPIELYQIPILEDNFAYILTARGKALVVDPGDAKPIMKELSELGVALEGILITHFHSDHSKGATALVEEYDCPVLGPKHLDLSVVDQEMQDGDESGVGPFSFSVIASPGHTLDHVMFYFPECNWLFTGDTLFLGGCGKMFEGKGEEYFQSIQRVKDLPDKTLLLVGHNYIKKNLKIAKLLEPENLEINLEDTSTVHTLEEEKKINPFLHAETAKEFVEILTRREEVRKQAEK